MAWRSKKAQAPPPDDDDDEGFTSVKPGQKIPPPSARSELMKGGKPVTSSSSAPEDDGEYDPDRDNPLRKQELEDLENTAIQKNKELTDSVLNVRRIAEETKGIAGQTLVTLQEQGDQITRVHEKATHLDKELVKGEKLLNKLGPMFSLGWKPKKGKKITGPTYDLNAKDGRGASKEEREELVGGGKGPSGAPVRKEGQSALDHIKDEKKFQDEVLDEVSGSLDVLKDMALGMGKEMAKQDKALDHLTEDVKELDNRIKQSNIRSRKLLGRK